MTHIDPEKLGEAIKIAEENLGGWGPSDLRRTQRMLLDVARAHLATLPRFKEETFARYLVVSEHEESGPYADPVDAESVARRLRGTVVTLTGTAKVRA